MKAEPLNVEQRIEEECADPKVHQKSVALSYAFALRVPSWRWPCVDFRRINAAILHRWPKGLERVKNMAWKIVEEGKR